MVFVACAVTQSLGNIYMKLSKLPDELVQENFSL